MKTKWIVGLLTLMLLGLSVWALMPEPQRVEVDRVQQGLFQRHIQEDGKTRLKNRYVVSSPLSARLARITLSPGDVVKRGATVAMLWPLTPTLLDPRARATAQARVGAAQAQLGRAAANQERARASAQSAEQERQRLDALSKAGFVSQAQMQAADLQAQQRVQEERMARLEQQAAQEELRAAQAALSTLASTLEPAKAASAPASWAVTSPVDAVVLRVHQSSEDVVQPGMPLLELGQPGDLEVVVDVLTQEAAQIQPGQSAILSHWGGPEALQAKVRLVEPAAFTKVSALGVQEQRVNVVLDITTPAPQRPQLGDGFKLDVKILVQSEESALMVPVSALFTQADQSLLFRLEGDRVRRQAVQVISRNGLHAWVKPEAGDSLPVGAALVVYPPATLRDGLRVRARSSPS